MNSSQIPIVTIDGPSGAGKGTVSMALAKYLEWHFLDSGAIYRLFAWAVKYFEVPWQDEARIAELANELSVPFTEMTSGINHNFTFRGEQFSVALKDEALGIYTSQIAVLPQVRKALLGAQRKQVRAPGLIADGRDMGTVVFPSAQVKFFLTASVEERARRRLRQLQDAGQSATFERTLMDMHNRDEGDRSRSVAPLLPAEDAVHVDSTGLDIDEVVTRLLSVMKSTSIIDTLGRN